MYQHPHFYHVTNEYLLLKKIAYFMISEFWTFGLQNLFVRTPEPFFSNLRTFGLKNLRTREPSNLRTFGLIGCNQTSLLLADHRNSTIRINLHVFHQDKKGTCLESGPITMAISFSSLCRLCVYTQRFTHTTTEPTV